MKSGTPLRGCDQREEQLLHQFAMILQSFALFCRNLRPFALLCCDFRSFAVICDPLRKKQMAASLTNPGSDILDCVLGKLSSALTSWLEYYRLLLIGPPVTRDCVIFSYTANVDGSMTSEPLSNQLWSFIVPLF